jgi:hypothetical protein
VGELPVPDGRQRRAGLRQHYDDGRATSVHSLTSQGRMLQ